MDAGNAAAEESSRRLADQIDKGSYGIENMDYKYLVHDLIVNEPELFEK